MRNLYFAIICSLFSLLLASSAFAERVAYVIDGDTVILDNRERVRLIGIDTPEISSKYHRGEYYGKEAKKYLKELIEGKEVTLEYGPEPRDKYGRRLAFLYLPDGTFVNEELVRLGYAETFRKYPFKYREDFMRLEKEAKEQEVGMWKKRKKPWWMRAIWIKG
jgi:micrococcal nuclease